MFGRIPLLFACALGLVAASVPADASAVVESAPYFTSHEERVLAVDNFDFDSGWLPAGSPISVRLTAHAGNTVYIEMDGTAHYDWEVEAVSFEGLPEGGLLEFDLGLETSAQVMFDILGYTWTGDLMDPILYGVFDELVFDPYLLMNHPGRVFSRSQLLDRVWGANAYLEERTVDVHIRRLRKALENAGVSSYLQTARGHGYRFLAQE